MAAQGRRLRPPDAFGQTHRHAAAAVADAVGAVAGGAGAAGQYRAAVLCAGHAADAQRRLRDQRLGRPRFRRQRGAHRRPAVCPRRSGGKGSAAVGGGAGAAGRLLPDSPEPHRLAVCPAGAVCRFQLSFCQALFPAAAALSGHRLFFRHSDGFRRRAGARAGLCLVAVCRQSVLDAGV